MRGRGVLFLVVGPSGVGKDSLIDGAKRLLSDDVSYYFPKRYITRPKDAGGEPHRAVTEGEFERLNAEGALMLGWEAHGHRYGIPVAAEEAVAAGRSVVVNVSRQVIEEARQRWQPVRILLVTAPRDVLATRLAARGRETDDDIQKRLDRSDAYRVTGDDVLEVVNAGRLDRAVDRFVALLEHELRMAVTPV
jgi:phosphonate metabolism protein PhnN/1,5-bisphosphokinase (PRPP-forming)